MMSMAAMSAAGVALPMTFRSPSQACGRDQACTALSTWAW
jgi:hypothetical protein